MSEISKIRVGISVGDPNGIGFEIILKTFEDKRIFDFFTPIGPLNFSLSEPITKGKNDITESFRFNLGTTF